MLRLSIRLHFWEHNYTSLLLFHIAQKKSNRETPDEAYTTSGGLICLAN